MVNTKKRTVKKVKGGKKKAIKKYRGKGLAAEFAAFALPGLVKTPLSNLLDGLRK